MRLSFLAAGIAVALFMSGGAKGIGTQAEGIVSGCVIGGTEGIYNCAQKAACVAPTVTAVSPNNGSAAGGTSVTVTGTNFTGALSVNFGPGNPSAFFVSGPTSIAVASTPSGSGVVDVVVTTPCGTSATSAADQFTYIPTYQGPGDLIGNAVAWYGLRCYSAGYSGNVVDITDTATGSTTGTRLQCSGGSLVALSSASACTFVTGNACSPLATTCAISCNVATLYDQSGANACAGTIPCDVGIGTNSRRPIFTQNCQNSRPCLTFNAANNHILATAVLLTSTSAQPVTITFVANRTPTANTEMNIFDSTGGVITGFNSTNDVATFAGTLINVPATDTVVHSAISVINGASTIMYVDGAGTTINPGTNSLSGQILLGGSGVAQSFTGQFMETGAYSIGLTPTQAATLTTNDRSATSGWNF